MLTPLAVADVLARLAQAPPSTRWSVNVSCSTVCDESFACFLEEQLAVHRVPSGSLCIEIAEAALNASQAQAPLLLARLLESGVAVALDDFGTGVASFAAIKNLNVDMLKIDADLIVGVLSDPVDARVVQAICAIADLAGIQVGAKGRRRHARPAARLGHRFCSRIRHRATRAVAIARPKKRAGGRDWPKGL